MTEKNVRNSNSVGTYLQYRSKVPVQSIYHGRILGDVKNLGRWAKKWFRELTPLAIFLLRSYKTLFFSYLERHELKLSFPLLLASIGAKLLELEHET